MKLSIVTTLYKSADHIEEFYCRASAVAREYADDDYEIIMVDDGSPDNSLEIAIDLTKNDNHLKVIELSRNFGQHKAIMTGLMHAQGDEVFMLDDDLEEEPEWLVPFAKEMKKQNSDVVYGVQETRKGGWFESLSGNVFYWLYNKVCGVKIIPNAVNARIMKKSYVKALIAHQEREIFIGGLMALAGFKQVTLPVHKLAISQSSYSFGKKLMQSLNAVMSFSNTPLYFIFVMGVIISLLSFIYAGYLIVLYMINGNSVDGWVSMMVSFYCLSGVILSSLGLVGLYVSKIFMEVKQRPYTVVRKIYFDD